MRDTNWAVRGGLHDPSCPLTELGVRERVVGARWP